jgi:DNA polymerase-1
MSGHLTLVDGSGFIFRAYHKLPPLTNPAGVPVGAVYGFTTMLWKLVRDAHGAGIDAPTHFAVVLDAGSHTFRNDLYDQYKANRPPPPEDLVPQFPLIREAVRAFSLPCFEQEGFEADDIIAAYAQAARAQGMRVTIVSTDKDLMQLVGEGVSLLDTMGNRLIGPAEVEEKFGVPPAKVGEVLALMGDSADNVPGVPGVGPKFAADLIRQFGDVETLLARVDEVSRPSTRAALSAHADMARLSRKLVELDAGVPLPEPIAALALKPTPPAPLRAFLAAQGFKSLLAKVEDGGGAPAQAAGPDAAPPAETFDRAAYETVTTPDRLAWWAAEAVRLGVVAVDTETSALDAVSADLVGVSLALEPGLACYIPIAHSGGGGLLGERPAQLALAEVQAALAPVLADPAVLKVGQNIKYDMLVLARHGLPVAGFDDTMLMSYALEAGARGGHGMDELSAKHLGHTPIAFKDVTGTGRKQLSFADVPLAEATAYAAEDADVTLRLWRRFRPRLHAAQVTRVYELIDRPLAPVVADMERAGVKVDRAALARLSAEFGEAMLALEGEIHALAGGPFNLGSVKQLGEVLFERLGLPGGRKSGKSGQWVTDAAELERLAEQEGSQAAAKLLEWRQLTKLKSTYTDALQAAINPQTGRVHTSFALAATSTGRISSNDPNLQNIPIRTDLGRQIRKAFIAEPGHVIIAADYNQIELRLMAHMAEVDELRAVYAAGGDVHRMTAAGMFGVPEDQVDREQRARAKTINFSIIYGISAFGLAGRLGVSRAEAADYIERYFARFPGIRRFMADQVAKARTDGFVTTLFGRRCHLPQVASRNQAERGFGERAAINAPVQGTAADIIKRAMARMPGALAAAGCGATRMLLQVHDELVFEAPEGEAERAIPVIRAVMAGACEPWLTLSVPLGVEVGIGPEWGAAH